MAKGYRRNDIDFDDRFDPDIMGNGPVAAGLRVNGVPVRYAHIQYGSKGPDVGYRENALDVSNKWAAKGTAAYANRGGIPDLVENHAVLPPTGGSSTAYIQYFPNGTVTWTTDAGGNSGTWVPGSGSPGANYEVRFIYTGSGSGGGGTVSFTGADSVWRRVDTDRSVALTITTNNSSNVSVARQIRVQLRRFTDQVVVVDFVCTLSASTTGDG